MLTSSIIELSADNLKFEILQENPRWVSSPTMSQWKEKKKSLQSSEDIPHN